MSQAWADMTDSSDDEGATFSTPPPKATSSLRRQSVGLLSAQLGSTHLSLGSIGSPATADCPGLQRVASVSRPVRTQIGFNLAQGDGAETASPGSVEGRPQPPLLRAVPSALSILNKELPSTVVKCEPHLEAVRQLVHDDAVRVFTY